MSITVIHDSLPWQSFITVIHGSHSWQSSMTGHDCSWQPHRDCKPFSACCFLPKISIFSCFIFVSSVSFFSASAKSFLLWVPLLPAPRIVWIEKLENCDLLDNTTSVIYILLEKISLRTTSFDGVILLKSMVAIFWQNQSWITPESKLVSKSVERFLRSKKALKGSKKCRKWFSQ